MFNIKKDKDIIKNEKADWIKNVAVMFSVLSRIHVSSKNVFSALSLVYLHVLISNLMAPLFHQYEISPERCLTSAMIPSQKSGRDICC